MNRYTKIKDFIETRKTGVGSADISTLGGFNAHYEPREYEVLATGAIEKLRQTPYTLYREKRGEIRQRGGGGRMEWGHRLEGLILAKWIENTGNGKECADAFLAAKIRGRSVGAFKTETECRMPDRPYVLAHADLLVDADDASGGIIVEAKSSGCYAAKRKRGEVFTGYDLDDRTYQGIPDSVYLQVQWQMLAYGVPIAYVAVLIDTGDYREYGPIPAAPRVQEKCLALAERFWPLVEAGTPPKPETLSDVFALWPEVKPYTSMLSGEDELRALEYAAKYWKLGESEKRIQREREELQAALGIYMGKNQYLKTASGLTIASSWTQGSPPSVDLKTMQEKEPELYARLVEGGYVRRGEYRRILPARIKEA